MSLVRLGIDFDNTIIDYDQVFFALAQANGWLPSNGFDCSKNSVKKYLLDQDGNDHRWQQLQALAYGPEIHRASFHCNSYQVIDGAMKLGWEIHIVSHKTVTSNWDPSVRLRDHAIAWMQQNKLIKQGDAGLIAQENVHFAATVEEKVEIIKDLKIDIFIDDLLKVLKHPLFPAATFGVWFNTAEAASDLFRVKGWAQIEELVKCIKELGFAKFAHVSRELGSWPSDLQFLKREGNNRIFVWQDKAKHYALKSYFHDNQDNRKRGEIEYHTLNTMWQGDIRSVPKPYFFNPELGLGLYQFIPGTIGKSASLPSDTAKQLLQFLGGLDRLYQQDKFPSDCFASHGRPSLQAYLDDNSERYRLITSGAMQLSQLSDHFKARLMRFLSEQLLPIKDLVFANFIKRAKANQFELKAKFTKSQLTFSPSDFGMHNTLVHQGLIHFIDFEYAGLDDAAKLLADFYHHVGHEISDTLKREFIVAYIASRPHDPQLNKRFQTVVDIIAFEWILIVLNVFSPGAIERRKFAQPGLNVPELLEMRLQKAMKMIETMQTNHKNNQAFLSLTEYPNGQYE